MFFHVGRTVGRYRWLIVGLWMVFFAIALPFAPQALTQVRGWSEVSGVISFADNSRQISLDRHAAYVNVLLKSDPDTALTPGRGSGDWFSIQLDNDTEMMLCLIRDAMGNTVSTYVELTRYTRGSSPCSKKFERMRVDILS